MVRHNMAESVDIGAKAYISGSSKFIGFSILSRRVTIVES
jgi:hypothetical protein